MTLAYFDCFAGAGGDMIVGSLLHAGADFEALQTHLARLGVSNYSVSAEAVQRGGIAGIKFNVDAGHEHHHRHLSDIVEIIDRAALPARASERAKRVFHRLAQAEAKVHGIDIDHVHFHEVGAIDSIMDIVGGCVCLELLGVDRIVCSPIPLGSGTVRCEHGVLPVPAPAVAELVAGVPVAQTELTGELTTPTAAAMFVKLADSFGPMPPMKVRAIGYGAGTRDSDKVPNLLRVFVGEGAADDTADTVVELSANIDDATGEILAAAMEKLFAHGCVDAWATPAVMKKGRPAWVLSALCAPADAAAVENVLFCETTTFGVRRHTCSRAKLARRHETVETPYGPVRVKIGSAGERDVTASPEFADCRNAADAHHVSVREVYAAATAAWRGRGGDAART